MVKQLLILLFVFVLALPLATTTLAQEAPAKTKPAKEARWDGTVIRSSPDKATLTVRKRGNTADRLVNPDFTAAV
jgi:biopolymer transport protein ExbD